MSEHVLTPGREAIDAIARLGVALGYSVALEWHLPAGGGAIDVAWLRDPRDPAPLLAFEVESRPGAGLASNAMKILGRNSAEGPKPLHLFHVVVRGGARSRRPTDTAREFAGHNYSVHLLAEQNEPEALLASILAVHRRLAPSIDGVAVGVVLQQPPWSRIGIDRALRLVEEAHLDGLPGSPIATLALRSPAFRPALARCLTSTWSDVLDGKRPAPDRYLGGCGHPYATYGSYMAEAAGEGLELGLIAKLEPDLREPSFSALRDWQEANHIGDVVGPFSGAGVQWTEYAVNHLGFYWALVAALFDEVPGARGWCASQPLRLVQALPASPWRALLAGWVMHALPPGRQYRSAYDAAASAIEEIGGIAPEWWARPRPAGPDRQYADEDEWVGVIGDSGGALPTPDELRKLVRRDGVTPADPVELALKALLEDPAARRADGAGLAAFLTSRCP